jgi:creatinine amidohydrolase/Fe(II)-dependent formamide hydrolase-like protein
MEFGTDTIVTLTREYLYLLSKMGFKVIVIILGHWGQRQGGIVRSVVAEFNHKQESTVAWAVQEDEIVEIKEDHGGSFETSLIMACLPGVTDLSRLPDRELSFKEDGVIGEDPRKGSSAERGRSIADEYVAGAGERIREMVERV